MAEAKHLTWMHAYENNIFHLKEKRTKLKYQTVNAYIFRSANQEVQ